MTVSSARQTDQINLGGPVDVGAKLRKSRLEQHWSIEEIADNLKKSGAFVPGIRPGAQTAGYIDKVVSRLTFAGAAYLTVVCLIPEFLIVKWNVPFYFGGTSLLIIVVVMMDMMSQVQSYLMSRQYESLMKKSSLVGGGMGMPR